MSDNTPKAWLDWRLDPTRERSPSGGGWLIDTRPDAFGEWQVDVYSAEGDGCMDLYRRHDGADGADEWQLHLCDLDEFIERLQNLRAAIKRELGNPLD